MHGMFLFDGEKKEVILKGFLNDWVALMILTISIFVLSASFSWIDKLFVFGLIGLVFGVPLGLGAYRCVKLASFAARAWQSLSDRTTIP